MLKGYKPKIVINQELKPINPIQCGKHQCESSHSFGPCIRNYYILHFVTYGKGMFTTESKTYEVSENQVFIIRPHETIYYEADSKTPWSYFWIGFTSTIELPPTLLNNDVITAPYLKELFITAYDNENIFLSGDTVGAYEYHLCGIIWQILGRLLTLVETDTKADMYLKLAISLMKSETRITVTRLAERIHISKGYLSRIFLSKYGISPGKYSFNLRMAKASELLLSGNTITDTAKYTGFPDLFAFSRAFKRHYGCAPSEYKKRKTTPSPESSPVN